MAIARTPIINDDGSGSVGTVWENAWKVELYDQIDAAIAASAATAGGPWADIPYSAANFGANGGGWTVQAGDQLTYAAWLDPIRKIVTLSVYLVNVEVTGAPSALHLVLPTSIGGRAIGYPARSGLSPAQWQTGGALGTGLFVTDLGQYYARLLRDYSGTAFAAGAYPFTAFQASYPIP